MTEPRQELRISSEQIVLCPLCGGDYVHPYMVEVNPAGNFAAAVAISCLGLHVDKTRKPDGRGVRVALGFSCENCAHISLLSFRFSKGQTHFAIADLGESVTEEGIFLGTIWRA